jgi:phosphate starvation-inducible protein PhoH and related proteins
MKNARVALLDRFFKKSEERGEIEDTTPVVEREEQQQEPQYEDHTKMPKKHKQGNMGKMHLKNIKPVTFTQEAVFKSFMSGGNLMLHGIAGTGKSFVGLYLALKEIERYQLQYNKVVIVRSGVPTRDLGYLPGNMQEKAAVYEAPYEIIVNKLYDRGDAYKIAKAHGLIEFTTTSFLRGMTFERCVVVVDEIQNMNYGELSTIITRMGDNCRVIFCGDFRQTDLFRVKEREGLDHFLNIIERMPEFSFHEFNRSDIVRGKLVRSFLEEEDDYRKANPGFDC